MAADSTETKIVEVFKRCDLNGDGFINRVELAGLLKSLCPHEFDDQACDVVLVAADKNKDGCIQYEEFVKWVCQSNGAASDIDKRPDEHAAMNYRSLLPERFDIDIAQRFALDRLALGEGGYGKVFVARDKEFGGNKVVVKKVTTFGTVSRTDLFKTEIAVMKELDHPNICKLFGTFEQGNTIFYVMEYCEGGELFERIINSGTISEAIAADITAQLAAALRYAHDRSIAHRDIKPENIVFCSKDPSDTLIKVIDWGFGISFANCRMTDTVGSTSYAAPEVIMAKGISEYTCACDLWSMGVMTYVMLVGRPCFWGTEKQHLYNAANEIYPFGPGEPFDSMSADCKDFIRALLKPTAAQRLPIASVVKHPWLIIKGRPELDANVRNGVLANIRRFTNKSSFSALCIAAVARQLDHSRLRGIHQVFRDMDKDGNGVLSYREISEGFGSIYGVDSAEYKEVLQTFEALDLDNSLSVDYTEFCAGGLGQHTVEQDEACWAAFKTFDVDNTGSISFGEMKNVLGNADLQKVMGRNVCKDVAAEIFDKHDQNKDGVIDFTEWMEVMRTCWERTLPPAEDSEAAKDAELAVRSARHWAYDVLQKVSSLK